MFNHATTKAAAALLTLAMLGALTLSSTETVQAGSVTVPHDGVILVTNPPDFFPDSECGLTVYLAVRSVEQAAAYLVTYTNRFGTFDIEVDEVRDGGDFKPIVNENTVYPVDQNGLALYNSSDFIGRHLFSLGSDTRSAEDCLQAVLDKIEQENIAVVSSQRIDWFDDPVPAGDAHISMVTNQDGDRCQYVVWWSFPDISGVDLFPYEDSRRPNAGSAMPRTLLTNELPDDPDIDGAGFSDYAVPGRIARAYESGRTSEKCASWKYRRLTGWTLSLQGGPVTPPALLCGDKPITIDMRLGASGIGTSGDDVIHGTVNADSIDGGDGNDMICGDGGDDLIIGGNGNDVLIGGDGEDVLRGGPGNDTIVGMDGNDRMLGGTGDDQMRAGDGDDFVGGFGGDDWIYGGNGNDTIFGGFGGDDLNGGPGNDTIRGLVGDDRIAGDAGDDVLDGDRGNDTIIGHGGDDIIRGGNANDDLQGRGGNDTLMGGRGDDVLSGGGDNDTCTGNKHTLGDVALPDCELIFGVP